MSKIICDVCGTSYPESATQCPICGCVRPSDSVAVDMEKHSSESARTEGYTYVKGGRFSKANVKKRNQGLMSEGDASTPADDQETKKVSKGDAGLIIALSVLLLAIIAVVIYIALHFFGGQNPNTDKPADYAENNTTISADNQTTAPVVEQIPCMELILSKAEVTLNSVGAVHLLNVTTDPGDTTEEIIFTSDNVNVATVSKAGKIEAVGAGEAVVTVTCGNASAQCRVICNIEPEPTDGVIEPDVPAETYTGPYKINKTDVTIKVGETFILKLSDANEKIVPVTWSVEKSNVCTVTDNSVTGAKVGTTNVTVNYENENYTCIVRVVG